MDNKEMNPIFFIGPGKSGTTFLYNLLKENSINLGKKKESNYFFRNRPLEKYLKEYKHNRIIDFSNVYFWNPNLGLKIIENFPDAVVVIIKRDPYSRLASHINYLYSRGEIIGDWREYLKNNRDLFISVDFDFYQKKWKNLFHENCIELDFNKINDINYLNCELYNVLSPLKDTYPDKYSTYIFRGNIFLNLYFKIGKFCSPLIPGKIIQLIKKNIEPLAIKFLGTPNRESLKAQDIIEFYSSYGI